ncbi:hypothetical protein ASD50_03645 [Mesorhizobium sp. Root552]|jgi:hypothetical protein|uniref:hypothetical protein n=1 Tax=Mesorhizobium sp. Root552 TaxID=1736555 RepID=UPI0006FFC14D|nr:hypothetical protein [Mesorhizobium sp. Root552]KQZ26512.1 hypothetical protein ASD50_03645 [Mesorhizobium sp. Root552]
MEYTDPVLRRLRDRLIRYRSEARTNGRKRPWHRVAMDILDAESVSPAYYEKEVSSEILGEALRRFAAGLQTPTVERLDAITAFLTEQHYLSGSDLGEAQAPLEAARQLAAFFGEATPRHLPARDALCGQFLALRADGGRKKYVLLDVSPVGDSGLQVEETEHSTSAVTQSRSPAELRRFLKVASTAVEKRDGWMVEAPRGQVIIFIRDRLNEEANVYTVVADDREAGVANAARNIHLLRPVPITGGARIVPLASDDSAPAESSVPGFLSQMIWHFSRQEEA